MRDRRVRNLSQQPFIYIIPFETLHSAVDNSSSRLKSRILNAGMRRSRSVKKEVVTGKKLGGSDIYISELDGIVDLLASNNRPKWEMEKRKREMEENEMFRNYSRFY